MADHLLPYPLTEKTVHLCVDMQRIFSTEGPWSTPWMERVLPVVVEIARRHPERTVFTRFITPERPQDMPGMWQHYYRRWEETTRERMNPSLLELLPELARFCPPAVVLSKTRYSGFAEPHLLAHLQQREADGLIITGSETDVCVLSTILNAVDLGLRVVIVEDALCSSSDTGHDALMTMYRTRFHGQIDLVCADELFEIWRPG